MKNSFNFIFVILLVLGAMIALINPSFAKDKKANNSVSHLVVDNYIKAATLGQTDQLGYIFADDFKQTLSINSKVENQSKTNVIQFLKSNKGLISNCETSYHFIENNKNCAIAKVIMKYENFTKIEYVTLCKEKQEWKINQITVSYK